MAERYRPGSAAHLQVGQSSDSECDGDDDADGDYSDEAEENPVPEAGVLIAVRCVLGDRGDNQVREEPSRSSSLVPERPLPAPARGRRNPMRVAPESSGVGHRDQARTTTVPPSSNGT